MEGLQTRRAFLGEPLGRRASRLAHRVLRDGEQTPARWCRHPRRRYGHTLPAPRERAGPERRGPPRRTLRPRLGPPRHGDAHERKDGEVCGECARHRESRKAPRSQRRADVAPAEPLLSAHRVLRGDPGREAPLLRAAHAPVPSDLRFGRCLGTLRRTSRKAARELRCGNAGRSQYTRGDRDALRGCRKGGT